MAASSITPYLQGHTVVPSQYHYDMQSRATEERPWLITTEKTISDLSYHDRMINDLLAAKSEMQTEIIDLRRMVTLLYTKLNELSAKQEEAQIEPIEGID